MALTKVSGGILDPGINVAGIVTATGFDGPFTGGSSKHITAGVVTATSLDLNGNGNISGNLVIGGNVTADGNFTTLNTTLREVEILHVDADSSEPAGIITQRGSGDILNLFDNNTEVLTVKDGGNVGIGSDNPSGKLDVKGKIKVFGSDGSAYGLTIDPSSSGGTYETLIAKGNADLRLQAGSASYQASNANILLRNNKNIIINAGNVGKVGIHTNNPDADLHVIGNAKIVGTGMTVLPDGNVSIGGTLELFNTTGDVSNNPSEIKISSLTISQHQNTGTYKIQNSNATGSLLLSAGGSGYGGIELWNGNFSRRYFKARDEGSIQLFHNNTIHFETSGIGATVFGQLDTTDLNVSGVSTFQDDVTLSKNNPTITLSDTNNNPDYQIGNINGALRFQDTTNDETKFIANTNGRVGINTNNPAKDFHVVGTSRFEQLDVVGFATFGSAGTRFYHHTPQIEMPGGNTATISFVNATTGTTAGSDGMLMGFSSNSQVGFINVNEGSHGFVLKTGGSAQSSERFRVSGVGTVSIRNGTEEMVNAKPNAAVELYHNGSKKFETTNTGVTVHGDLAASQDYPNFRPTLDLNFTAERKLDPRITYSRNGLASFVNEFGKVVLIGNNVPRFDYDPITRERKGLLIELQRTNLFTYSSEFDQINWSNVRTTDSKTVATNDPQGLQTAFKLIANTDNNTHRLDKINLSMSTSTVYTMSVWAKAAEYTGVSLTIADSSNNTHGVYFDLSAGTFTIGSNAHTGKMEAYPNGWYRCFATFTTPSTINFNQCLIGVLQNGTTHTYTGNGSSGIYIWGAQLEQGAFETSYIHTSAATGTRGADLVSIEGEEFSEFYNQTEGSFVSEIMLKPSWPLSGYASITLTLSDNSYNNRITLASSTGSAAFNADVTISGSTSRASLGSYTSGSHSIKAALAYKASDSAGSLNGAAAVTSSPGTLPLLTRADIGKDHNNGNLLNGHIKRIMYYSHRLPNSQLVTLTS